MFQALEIPEFHFRIKRFEFAIIHFFALNGTRKWILLNMKLEAVGPNSGLDEVCMQLIQKLFLFLDLVISIMYIICIYNTFTFCCCKGCPLFLKWNFLSLIWFNCVGLGETPGPSLKNKHVVCSINEQWPKPLSFAVYRWLYYPVILGL